MKIVLFNLDVGSSIEQSGNEIFKWLKDKDKDIDVYKSQNNEKITFDYLMEIKPNIIILNGDYERVITPIYYYKQIYKETKIIYISRNQGFLSKSLESDKGGFDQRLKFFLEKDCDYIIPVNICGEFGNLKSIKNKILNCCGINDEERFYIKKPWDEREKKFLILGSLNSHKLSRKFLKKIQNTDITIDCFGNINNQFDGYRKVFWKCKNLNYLGQVPFEEVPNVLNEYKYYLLPHNGYEPFCNSLQQAILCGCIPLVVDDYYEYQGRYWLEWAKKFYFGTSNLDLYINNLKELADKDMTSGEIISELNRKNMVNKYGVWRWKNRLLDIISKWEEENSKEKGE